MCSILVKMLEPSVAFSIQLKTPLKAFFITHKQTEIFLLKDKKMCII